MTFVRNVLQLGVLIGVGLSAGAALSSSPNGQTYNVSVFSSFGTQFNDCFTFDNTGKLTVRSYGPEIFTHDQLNTQPEAWQATPATGSTAGFILSLHGIVGGSTGQTIDANGTNEFGDTFILQGVAVPGCPPAAAVRTSISTSPYRKH